MRLSLLHTHHYPHCYQYHHRSSSTRMDARKDKVVVIMGATGSGKSRLSIDLATLFPFSEIINSDKMQVYSGLDITTNKIPLSHRRRVSHVISDITSRHKLPILVGGSNSFVHALLVQHFNPDTNVFDDASSPSSDLRYNCCFLWMDISFPVLSQYLLKRVDDMLDSGMLDELAQFFNSEEDADPRTGLGLRKAIGVPEFDRFFKQYPTGLTKEGEDPVRERAYQEAVRAIKENTCQLAKKQIGKILRLQRAGWDLQRIDATEVFRAVLTSGSHGSSDVWERQVLEPSVKIVKRFLME